MTYEHTPEEGAKRALESALRFRPGDLALRRAYIDHLRRANRTRMGLLTAEFPELRHPLYFRAGSSDLDNLGQIFDEQEFAGDLGPAPKRILDLGAFVGYASVYLANRFPDAEIVSVEPSRESFAVLTANTAAYPQITRLNGGVWSSSGTLVNVGHPHGDWGARFAIVADAPPSAGIQAWSVDDILRMRGWSHVDMIKCDIEGGELEVFRDPGAPWLGKVNCVTLELHDHFAPGCSEAVASCFPPERFEVRRHGELVIYTRRTPVPATEPGPEVKVLDAAGPLQSMQATDVPDGFWGLAIFDRHSIQLHPNPPGERPSTLTVRRVVSGHSAFRSGVLLANPEAHPVVFTVTVRDIATGEIVLQGSRKVTSAEPATLMLHGRPVTGEVEVMLQTEMAPGAPHYHGAWAQWISPVLTHSQEMGRQAA
jgi:FkbM family methyltransferase